MAALEGDTICPWLSMCESVSLGPRGGLDSKPLCRVWTHLQPH